MMLILAALYVVCGVLAWGRGLSYIQDPCPAIAFDVPVGLLIPLISGLSGPFGLLIIAICTFSMGDHWTFRWLPVTRAEAYADHMRRWPSLPWTHEEP